jgi:hypothetical protein
VLSSRLTEIDLDRPGRYAALLVNPLHIFWVWSRIICPPRTETLTTKRTSPNHWSMRDTKGPFAIRSSSTLAIALMMVLFAVASGPVLTAAAKEVHRPSAARRQRVSAAGRDRRRKDAHHKVATERTASAPSSVRSTSAGGAVIFDGSNPASWINQSAASNRVRHVADPDGGDDDAIKMTSYNSDVAPLTPTANPRAQLVTPGSLRADTQIWESFEVYLPADFPESKTYGAWIALGSPFYGRPWRGTPPEQISIENGEFRFERNGEAPDPYEVAWEAPLVLGRWVRFTWHLDLARSGWAQLYVDDVEQTLTQDGTSYLTLPMATKDASNYEGPWSAQLAVYYELDKFSDLTVYFKNFKIATTQAAAEG